MRTYMRLRRCRQLYASPHVYFITLFITLLLFAARLRHGDADAAAAAFATLLIAAADKPRHADDMLPPCVFFLR